MNRGSSILAVCALFLSGVAIGALGMHLYYAERLSRPGAPPAMATRGHIERLERRLDLTADQREAIAEILANSRRQGAEFRERMRPEVEEIMEDARERIEELLTPEQREAMEEMRRFDRRGLEWSFLGPAPPSPRGPRDRRDRWRERRPPGRVPRADEAPAPRAPERPMPSEDAPRDESALGDPDPPPA